MCPETAFSLTPDSIQVCPISLQAWKSQETEFNISTIISSQVFPIKTLLERLDQELLAWEDVFICLQILVGMIQCHKTLFNLWSKALIKVNFFKKSWVQNILHKHPLSSMLYLNIMQLYYIVHRTQSLPVSAPLVTKQRCTSQFLQQYLQYLLPFLLQNYLHNSGLNQPGCLLLIHLS